MVQRNHLFLCVPSKESDVGKLHADSVLCPNFPADVLAAQPALSQLSATRQPCSDSKVYFPWLTPSVDLNLIRSKVNADGGGSHWAVFRLYGDNW